MRATRRSALVACATLVLFAGAWLWLRAPRIAQQGDSARAESAAPADELGRGEEQTVARALAETSGGELAGADAGEERRGSAVDRVQVVSESGKPLEGAVVSWTPLVAALLEPYADAKGFDPEPLRALSREGVTDQDGTIVFHDLPPAPAPDGAVLWVTHGAHEARSLLLSAAERIGSKTLVLAPGRGPSARVARRDGGSPAGARVLQLLRRPGGLDPEADRRRTLAERSFSRVASVPEQGSVLLAPLGEEHLLRAEQESACSEALACRDGERVELLLGPSFVVGGQVRFAPGTSAEQALVSCLTPEGDARRAHALVSVREDGQWGPVRLPLLEATPYLFALGGPSFLPQTARLEEPAADHEYSVDFETRTGFVVRVDSVDEAGAALPGTLVHLGVLKDAGWELQERVADSDGRASFQIEPAGTVWMGVSRPGRQPASLGPLEVWTEPVEPFRIELAVAGRVRGRCLHHGEPVRDFTVFYWGENILERREQRYRGREDGSFELDTAPLGTLRLVAYADGFATSGQVQVPVAAEEIAEVDLELLDGLPARGRVADADTQEPVAGAAVVGLLKQRESVLAQRADAVRTALDGTFQLDALDPGPNMIRVEAEGYAPVQANATPSAEGVIDFGTILLAPTARLSIRLEGGTPAQYATCRAQLSGPRLYPPQPFDVRGELLFEGLEPGHHQLSVFVGGEQTISSDLNIAAAEARTLVLRIACEHDLRVEVVPAPGSELPRGATVSAFGGPDFDGASRWFFLPESGVIDLPVCGATESGGGLVVQVDDATNNPLAAVPVSEAELATGLVRVELGGPTATVRVLDRKRRPVNEAAVLLCLADGPALWARTAFTDAEGMCRFPNLGERPVLACVRHPSAGLCTEVPLAAGELFGAGAEIVLRGEGRLALVLRDGSEPVAGATVEIFEARHGELYLADLTSAADGSAVREKVDPGRYECRLGGPGLWSTSAVVEPTIGGPPTELQVRRLGSLAIVARRLGAAASGVRVDLSSLELGERVADWLAAGRARATSVHLETDAEGRLRIDGLPRGAYAWWASEDDELVASGEVEVPARAVGQLDVLLP